MSENGSMIPLFGGLVVIAFVVLGLTVDIARLQLAYRNVATVADLATEAAASALDEAAMHLGHASLDPERAVRVAERTARRLAPGTDIAVEASPDAVCATVRTTMRATTLAFVGRPDVEVSVRSCAAPAVG